MDSPVTDWLLLLGFTLLAACGPDMQRESRSSEPLADSKEGQSEALKETPLMSNDEPFVVDLGGAKAAQVECALRVEFLSIGTGTDNVARMRILRLLEDDSDVAEIEEFIVGREGESVLCIGLKPNAGIDRLFNKLREAAVNSYMVSIRSSNAQEFRSQRDIR